MPINKEKLRRSGSYNLRRNPIKTFKGKLFANKTFNGYMSDLEDEQVNGELEDKIDRIEKRISNLGMNAALYPPKFNGKTNFIKYLKTFNKHASALEWNPAKCCQLIPLFLEEEALAAYDSLDKDDKNTWKKVCENLNAKLQRTNDEELARKQLADRKQKPEESIIKFANEIRELVDRAFSSATMDATRPGIALDYFRNGLRLQLKDKLLYMEKPNSLEEAIKQAKTVEEILRANEKEREVQMKQLVGKKEIERKIEEIEQKICSLEITNRNEDNTINFLRNNNERTNQNYGNQSYSNQRGRNYGNEQNYGNQRGRGF